MTATTKNQICVVIGASHGGVNLAFSLRKQGWEGDIILYDADPEFPYHRPPLSKGFLTDEEGASQYLLFPKENYDIDNITLKLGVTITNINRKDKNITLHNNTVQPYDKLVIATGARPFIPPIPGITAASNIFPMRTAEDAKNIRKVINTSSQKRVVIIGGGYIGLETAASLKKIGATVTVLEREERILARVTAPVISEYFTQLHTEKGVAILTNKNVSAIEKTTDGNIVICDDTSEYKADLIVVGVGIRVNTELAAAAELTIENNSIKVDENAKTNDPHIYAIGDCTYHFNPHYNYHLRLESVQNAVDQAKVVAAAICQKPIIYDTIPWFWSDQFDIKLQMVGLSKGYNDIQIRKEATEKTSFSVWYFKDNELLAVDGVNNAKAYMLGTKIIKGKQKINKAKLVDLSIPMKPTSFLAD